jgi:hypothetical protein
MIIAEKLMGKVFSKSIKCSVMHQLWCNTLVVMWREKPEYLILRCIGRIKSDLITFTKFSFRVRHEIYVVVIR